MSNINKALAAIVSLQNDETAIVARDGRWQDWHDTLLADAAEALIAENASQSGDVSPPEPQS